MPDLLIDEGKQSVKLNQFYQQMSPQNILSQNVVFDMPLNLTIERLGEKLSIDSTLSFVKSATIAKKTLKRLDSVESLIAMNTTVEGVLHDQIDGSEAILVELLLSDSVVVPTMSRAGSSLTSIDKISGEGAKDAEEIVAISALPILQKFAANDGISALISSAI